MDSFDDKLRKQGEEILNHLDNQEKIEEVLRLIKKLSIHTKNDMGDGKFSINIPKITLDDLEEIKKILEK